MRFASLGSGSKGNATLVEHGDTRLLLDCGFNVKETVRRLGVLGVSPHQLSGILVTHEHGDHISGVGPLARKFQLPVWLTRGTFVKYQSRKSSVLPQVNFFSCHQSFEVGSLSIDPFPVPHDAVETSQFVVSDGQHRLALVTDAGHVTPHMVNAVKDCDSILLEFNHDVQMLESGPYPPQLKFRVGGQYGHLNNDQALGLLMQLPLQKLQHVVAMHVSEKNNCPDKVAGLLKQALGSLSDRVFVARQDEGFGWREFG